jgi:hypothetical protein
MARFVSNLNPAGVGNDLGVNAYAVAEARSSGDLARALILCGCPEDIARQAAKREELRKMFKPQTREDHELLEKAVRTSLEVEADARRGINR